MTVWSSTDEAMRIDPDHEVVFVAGQQPIYARKLRYFVDKELLRRAAKQPPVSSDRLGFMGGCSWAELAPCGALVSESADPAVEQLTALTSRDRGLDEDLGRLEVAG